MAAPQAIAWWTLEQLLRARSTARITEPRVAFLHQGSPKKTCNTWKRAFQALSKVLRLKLLPLPKEGIYLETKLPWRKHIEYLHYSSTCFAKIDSHVKCSGQTIRGRRCIAATVFDKYDSGIFRGNLFCYPVEKDSFVWQCSQWGNGVAREQNIRVSDRLGFVCRVTLSVFATVS